MGITSGYYGAVKDSEALLSLYLRLRMMGITGLLRTSERCLDASSQLRRMFLVWSSYMSKWMKVRRQHYPRRSWRQKHPTPTHNWIRSSAKWTPYIGLTALAIASNTTCTCQMRIIWTYFTWEDGLARTKRCLPCYGTTAKPESMILKWSRGFGIRLEMLFIGWSQNEQDIRYS